VKPLRGKHTLLCLYFYVVELPALEGQQVKHVGWQVHME
jgi:hypothetical protein